MTNASRSIGSPIQIGTMRLKNRIVMAPMHTVLPDTSGAVGDDLIAYLDARAAGGAGLIVMEHAAVEAPRGNNVAITLNVSHDRFVPGLAKAAEAVKAHGACISLQIDHAGRQTSLRATQDMRPVSASDVPWAASGLIPQTLTREDLAELRSKFVDAAVRAKTAGFDAVTVHAGHGYLLSSFLSGFTNTRSDEYGGSVERRVRFVVEIIDGVREAIGADFPIVCRMNASDHVPGGVTVDEAIEIALHLETAGVSAIDVTSGMYESSQWTFPGMVAEPGVLLGDAARIKEAVSVPVIGVGKISETRVAEKAVAEGQVDLVAFGREMLADPELPKKMLSGREAEIRPCIYANSCLSRVRKTVAIACDVNPEAGRERTLGRLTTQSSQVHARVLVVGAGPAGIEAALTAADLGCQVTMWDQGQTIGGRVRDLARYPWRVDTRRWLAWAERQLLQNNVEVVLDQAVTGDMVGEGGFDAVVVAAGRSYAVSTHVSSAGRPVLGAAQAVRDPASLPDRIAVVGSSQVLCEAALYLSYEGKRVVLYSNGPAASDAGRNDAEMLRTLLAESKVQVVDTDRVPEADNVAADVDEGVALVVADGPSVADSVSWDLAPAPTLQVLAARDRRGNNTIMDAVYAGRLAARRMNQQLSHVR